jgi:hypothetical protein
MTNDRRLALALSALLALAVTACGGSSGPLNNPSVVTDIVTLKDSMYNDSTWDIPIGNGPIGTFQARVATIPVSAITPAIANNGLVLVYVNTDTVADSAAVWTLLPYSVGLDYLETFSYAYSPGQIKIGFYATATSLDFCAPDVYLTTVPTTDFKIVIASGSTATFSGERRGSP